MLTYEPDATVAHRLDPRSKLLFQVGFAVAAFGHRSPLALAGVTVVALAALAAARLSPLRVLRESWFILVLLGFGAVLATVVLHPPWFVPERAVESLVSAFQVILVLFVAGAFVRSTPVRGTRAAVQRHVPGRIGQLLGVGVAMVFRLLPVLEGDVRQARAAIRARGGDERSAVARIRLVVRNSLRRALARADRLSVALRARCFAWNPTLPALSFESVDYPVLAASLLLALSPLIPV